MLNLKNKLAKRILAFVLSGAMVVSGMSTSGMTAFAAEASAEAYSMESSEDTNTHLEEEAAEEQQGDGAKADVNDAGAGETDREEALDKEDTDKELDKDVSDKEDSDNEAALDKETLEAEASKEEDKKDSESNAGDAEDEMTASADAEEEVQDTDIDNKAATHTVWIVGDSTVCEYDPALTYYPKYGYGTQVQNYLDETYVVNNLALSGRSSKSFLSETNYGTLKDNIQPGDVLIIGWGHNDEKAEADRYTNPNGDYQTKGSFAESLYTNYVKMAQDKQAFPILCTPIVRRNGSSDTLTPSNCHNTDDQVANGVTYKGGDYAQAIRDLGTAVNVPVVDLTAKTKELYESLGKDETLYLHMWSSSKPTSVDNTHINIYGAKKIAYILVTEIRNLTDLDIAAHVKENITEPTKEDLVVNDKYVEKEYTPPKSTDKSAKWKNYGIFRGTIFGSAVDANNAKLEKDSNGDMHMQVTGDKGKIASDNDSISMYFYQISADSKFTLSATAKVNSIDANGQVGFGLMARDDMYIDSTEAVNSDYVAAGTLGKNSPNCFKRQDVTQTKGKKLTTGDVKAGDTVNLKIRRTPDGDGYECTYGNESPQTGGFDFALNTVDSEYIYIGMFAARNIDVTFSNIELIIDGKRINIETGNPIEEGGETGGTDEGSEPKPDQSDEGSEPKPSQSDEGSEPKPDQSDEGGEPKPKPSDEGGEPKPKPSDEGGEPKPKPSEEESGVAGTITTPEEESEVEQSKIVAEGGTSLNPSNTDITVKAANLAATKKQQWAITVTYKHTVSDGTTTKIVEQELTEGLHYDVKLLTTDAISGPQEVLVKGTEKPTDLGTFKGERKVQYTLIPKVDVDKQKDITKACKLKINKDSLNANSTYTGTYVTPAVDGLESLTEGADYQLVYKNNVNAGKASVTVIGLGSYHGSKTLTFTIKPANIAKSTMNFESTVFKVEKGAKDYTATLKEDTTNPSALTYKGSAVTLGKLSVKLGDFELPTTDYTITYKKNAQAGTATATIKALNNCTGAIKINYEIANPTTVTSEALATATGKAELTAKTPAVTEVTVGDVTLKAGVDFKADNKALRTATLDQTVTVKITGIGSYKKKLEGDVPVKVVKGTFHIKDNTVVDITKGSENKKLISAAKVTDANGTKVKDITITPVGNIGIKVTPGDSIKGNFRETLLSCHVAKKLSSVKIPKGQVIEPRKFDGVNKVTLTTEDIAKILPDVNASDIRIVSYKNNHKAGNAIVTIEGRPSSAFYGTMNVKFKIEAVAKPKTLEGDSESGGTGESGSEENSGADESTGEGPDENTSDENTSDENLPQESSSADETLPDDPTPSGKRIDVWDFGGYEEEDTDTYNNNITPDLLKPLLSQGGTLGDKNNEDADGYTKGAYKVAGPAEFGDLSMYYELKDRLYTNVSALSDYSAGTSAQAQNEYDENYTSAGAWYSNGSRTDKKGYIQIKVQAGDKIIAYMGNHNKDGGDITFMFAGQGNASAQAVEAPISGRAFGKFTFVAEHTGTYKIYQGAGNGKPMYHRVMRVPSVTVSGTINLNGNDISGYGLRFINQTDKTLPDIVATVKTDGTFTAQLSPGYTYRALLTGVVGYGIVARNNGDKVTTTDANAVNGITNLTFTVEPQETYTYSGTIEGFAEGYDVSKLAITMEPTQDFDTNPVDLTIDTTAMTFSAKLEPNVRYTLALEGVNDYEIKSPDDVCKEDQSSNFTGKVITVALKPMYDVIGGFNGLKEDVTVEKLIFENVADKYEYEATVANGGYSIRLRDGEYLAHATVSDTTYSTTTHVVVDGGMVSQDLLFVSSASKENIEYEADIYVGYPKQTHNYATVNEAVEAARLMKVGDKDRTDKERVTIHIAPGTYREQIIVNTPYISFENDTNEEVLVTWYYGIGYVYYSAKGGYYNAENAYDKYAKGKVDKWGVAVYLQKEANGFRAKGITFENSFNRYITDEELADGVEPAVKYTSDKLYTDTSIAVERKYGVDVASKSATERAAAMAIEANQVEFKDCGFYSSQDTLYIAATSYFKNCVIEGQTDYIFGSGNVVFDACELSWKGYSTGSQGGYITAVKPSAGEKGYLFRNCSITANDKLEVQAGYYGRPWGADATVKFMNTKLQSADLISAEGWHAMSDAQPENANFYEYKTTTMAGAAVSTSSKGKEMTDEQAKAIKVSDYFGSWPPTYYTGDVTGDVTFSAQPTLSDNGDINVPNPGHTLTVNYALNGDNAKNDVSTIKWYIMDDVNGTNAKVAKVTTASVDKTYKITKDASKKYIKVEVIPEIIDGTKGTAQSVVLPEPVGENYVDPSSGSNITVGDGINVYLAGDSTVMDYSAKGMWNNGKSQDLGSWGEYLQSFFNESEVTVQDFAEGGRSSRSFINDDLTNKKKFSVIKENISEGDYLFIQFGHNDSSTLKNKQDVYTPIGPKGSDGKYPYTSGSKGSDGRYPDYYTYSGDSINWDGGTGTATYCWFLQQYVDMALEAKAIPVIMSPVARMQYSSTGNKTHHEDEHNANSYYWEAAKQVYEDNKAKGKNVLFIDAYGLTTELFNGAYADGGEPRGKEIMSISDGTHNNKLGGMVEAMLVAEAIQNLDTPLSYAVKTPSQVSGVTTTEKTVFSIDSSSNFAAYEQKFTGNKESAVYTADTFTTKSVYWSNYGNTKLANISKKAGELANSNISDSVVAAPKATSEMSDADGKTIVTVTLSSATPDAKIYYTDDGVTNPKASDGKTAVETAKEYNAANKIVLDKDTTIKAFAMAENKTASKVVTFTFSVKPDVQPPTADKETGSSIASGTVIHLEAMDGAEIRYTMGNGSKVSDPTANSSLYDKGAGLTITSSTTIKAIAIKNGVKSDVATFEYVVNKMQTALNSLSPMMIDASQSIQAA